MMSKILGKDYEHVYAIVRVDEPFEDIQLHITVKEIVWSKDKAEQEVERLNQTNSDKGCSYFWQLTRLDNQK